MGFFFFFFTFKIDFSDEVRKYLSFITFIQKKYITFIQNIDMLSLRYSKQVHV